MIRTPLTRWLATTLVVCAASLGLVACGDSTTGPEVGADVQDVQREGEYTYDGLYIEGFYDAIPSYDGESVKLSADVNEIISDHAFTIAGGDVEALLVIHDATIAMLAPGVTVQVSGTIHKVFDLPTIEHATDLELDDGLFADWGAEPYLELSNVDVLPSTDGTG